MKMNREDILRQIWESQDEAYLLMTEYDSLPHHYGTTTLYQAEAYIINWIGRVPGITTTALAKELKKTPSACSQIVRKLIMKNLVTQERNAENKRLYNLRLTADGEKVYQDHASFNEYCQSITFDMLAEFTEAELNTCLRVQQRINEAYHGDVERSRKHFGEDPETPVISSI